MKCLVPLVFVPLFFGFIYGFNLDTKIPVIKKGQRGSYFGFSVAEHQSVDDVTRNITNTWLLVGAPLDKNLQPGTNHSGALWKCPLTTRPNDCIQVITDGQRDGAGRYRLCLFSSTLSHYHSEKKPK